MILDKFIQWGVPILIAVVVGYVTYKFNVRAEYKRRQLDWLSQAYAKFVVDISAFFNGSSKTAIQKEEISERILNIYSEAQLLASPAVVRHVGDLIDSLMKGGNPDDNARLYKKIVLAMRKQIQGKFLDLRIKQKDIKLFSLIKQDNINHN